MSYTEQNQKWCMNAKWRAARWESLKYTFGDGTIVRYVDEPALSDMEGLCAWLLDPACCAAGKLAVNGKVVDGAYVPVAAWWEDVTIRGQQRTRLYHECMPAASVTAGTAYVTENNCTWKVTVTPYFRQAAVAVPTPGTSGVTYRVMQDRVDPRTGLWMFVLEKREQMTTTTGVVTAADDIFKTVWEQTFYGVRTGNTDHTGAAIAALWTPGNPTPGTLYETVDVQKNDNCTTNVSQRKTVEKEVALAGHGIEKDQFQTVETTDSVSATALGDAPAADAGLITGHSEDKTSTGLYKRRKKTEQEQDVAAAAVTQTKDQFSSETETEDVAASALGAVPEPDAGLVTTHKNVKTRGKKYRRTKREVQELDVADAVKRVTKDQFNTVTETEDVAAAALGAAPAPSAGLVTTHKDSKTPGKKFRRNKREIQEIAVTDAVKVVSKTPFDTVTLQRHVSQAAAAADPTNPGVRVKNEKTDGILVTQEVETRAANTGTDGAGILEKKLTTVQGLVTTVETATRNKTAALTEETAQTAGTARTAVNTLNDLGVYDVREIVETGAKWVYTYTVPDVNGAYTVTLYFNHTQAEELALVAALSATNSNSFSPDPMNRFGKYDGRIVSRPLDTTANAKWQWEVTGKTFERTEAFERGGKDYVRTWKYTFSAKRDWGISSGYAAYSGAKSGSSFEDLGGDWYHYVKVTKIEVKQAEVTLNGTYQEV